MPEMREKTSGKLVRGELYSRAALAKFFGVPAEGAINTGVFQPDRTRYASIWLFVTEEKEAEMTPFVDKLEGDTLHWQGQLTHRTDDLIINHESLGLEIVLFYRKTKRQHPNAAFICEGQFEYRSHSTVSDYPDVQKPTSFILGRCKTDSNTNFFLLPQTKLIDQILHESGMLYPCYLLLSLIADIQENGPSSVDYPSIARTDSRIRANAIVAKSHGVSFDHDPLLSDALSELRQRGLDFSMPKDKLLTQVHELCRRSTKSKQIKDCLALTLTSPYELSDRSSANIWSEARDRFEEGLIPFRLLDSELLFQVHPEWILYFESQASPLTKLLAERVIRLCNLNDSLVSAIQKCFFFDRNHLLAALESKSHIAQTENEITTTQKVENYEIPLSIGLEDQPAETKPSEKLPASDERSLNCASDDKTSESAKEQPTSAPGSSSQHQATAWQELPLALDTSELAPQTASFDSCLNTLLQQALAEALSRLNVQHYCLILSLLQFIKRHKEALVPASIISELTCSKLATIVAREFEIANCDLIKRLPPLAMHCGSMEGPVPGVAHSLTPEIVGDVLMLAIELEDKLVAAIRSLVDYHPPRSVFRISQSSLSVDNRDWFNFLSIQNDYLQSWIAAKIFFSLAKDGESNTEEALNRLYAIEPQLKQAAMNFTNTPISPNSTKAEADEKETPKEETQPEPIQGRLRNIETKAPDVRCIDTHSVRSLQSTDEHIEYDLLVKDEILTIERQNASNCAELPADSTVDVTKLAKLFEHTTASYKYLFFIALLRLADDSASDQCEINFQAILIEMLVFAAGIVRLNAHVSLGSGDRIIETLAQLDIKGQKFAVPWNQSHEEPLRNKAETHNAPGANDLFRYVPFLLIRPFVNDRIPRDLSAEALHHKIAELSAQFFIERKVLYRINRQNGSITLNAKWRSYLIQHRVTLIAWVCNEFARYLFKRNPITNKLSFYIGGFLNHSSGTSQRPRAERESSAEIAKDAEHHQSAFKTETNRNEELAPVATTIERPPVVIEASIGNDTTFKENPSQELNGLLISQLEASYEQASYLKQTETSRNTPPSDSGSLLAGISETDQFSRIEQAFTRIADKLDGLPARRSLCDLEISADDYLWLAEWCTTLNLTTARDFLVTDPGKTIYKGYTKKCAIGALLLILCAEVNRRDGQEGAIWPLFLNMFSENLDSVIRSKRYEGQVDYLVRAALKAAFNQLSLRNVLDSDDHAQYLLSTFLQFGFTRYGIRQVPVWLTNSQSWTEAIRQLLSDNSPNYSQSFANLWQDMQNYHGRRITETHLRSTLKASNWVLPEWHNELIGVIHDPSQKYFLPVPRICKASFSTIKSAVSPKLCWEPPDDPYFVLDLNFELMNLSEDQSYTLTCNGRPYSLHRGLNEWRLSSIPKLALDVSEVTVTVVEKDSGIVFSDTARIWHEDRDVQVFDIQTGHLLDDEAHLRQSRAYAILASADLLPVPLPEYRKSLNEIERKLYMLPANWNEDFHICLYDEVLWRATTDKDEARIPTAVHRIKPTIERSHLAPGEPVTISIRGESDGVKVEAIRVNGISVEVSNIDGRTRTKGPVPLGSNAGRGKVQILTKIRCNGKIIYTRHKLDIKVAGCAYLNGSTWTSLSEDSILTVKDCRSRKFQLSDPTGKNITRSDFGIFEGNTFRQRLSNTQQLTQILGTGAPIEIRKLFNRGLDSPPVSIAGGVIDSGEIANLTEISAVELRIEFEKPLTLSEAHAFMVWPDDSAPIWLKSEHMRPFSDRAWDFVPCTASTNLAVALSYDGLYQGAAWPENQRAFLRSVVERMEPKEAAALIRWMKWPVLSKESLPAIRQFAFKYPGAVLAAWLKGEGLEYGLKFGCNPATDGWDDIAREVFESWSPTSKCLDDITKHLTNGMVDTIIEERIAKAALLISGSSPILMAKYLRAYFQHSVLADIQLNKKALIHAIASQFVGNDNKFTDKDFAGFEQKIIKDCSKDMTVDENWLKNQSPKVDDVLNRLELNEETLNNLYSIMSFQTGRKFLCNSIIRYFLRTIQ